MKRTRTRPDFLMGLYELGIALAHSLVGHPVDEVGPWHEWSPYAKCNECGGYVLKSEVRSADPEWESKLNDYNENPR
jgi:hypothetical protein